MKPSVCKKPTKPKTIQFIFFCKSTVFLKLAVIFTNKIAKSPQLYNDVQKHL